MFRFLHSIHQHLVALRLWLRCRRDADLSRRVNCLLALYQDNPDPSLH